MLIDKHFLTDKLMALYSKAETSLNNQDYNKAHSYLSQFMGLEGSYIDAYLLRADIYKTTGEYGLALESHKLAAQKIDRLHPLIHYKCSAIFCLLGKLFNEHGDIAKANEALDKAIFQDHQNFEAINLKAGKSAELYDQDYKSLRKFYKELGFTIANMDEYEEALNLYKSGEYHASLNLLNNIAKFNHYAADYHFLKSLLYYELGNFTKTIEEAKEAEKFAEIFHNNYHEESALCYINQAECYQHLGQIELASACLGKAIDLDKNSQLAYKRKMELTNMGR